jgi:class 3 adenylate cyclase
MTPALHDRVLSIGADPRDTADERFRKRLLVGVALIILPIGFVWAGVIGRRRFLYDLWGDTVNMASRMESHGTPDTIQITRSTFEFLRDDFVVEPIGLVEGEGKGGGRDVAARRPTPPLAWRAGDE